MGLEEQRLVLHRGLESEATLGNARASEQGGRCSIGKVVDAAAEVEVKGRLAHGTQLSVPAALALLGAL